MPALNFKCRFASDIVSGAKRQTFRRQRKRPIKAGDTLYLYTGMRTKRCEHLLTTKCTRVYDVLINRTTIVMKTREETEFNSGRRVLDPIAVADGFDSWDQLVAFFEDTGGLPFVGQLIMW